MTPHTQSLINSITGAVLVVDDDPRNRKLLKDLLTIHGHTVTEAENGVQALQMVESQPPDLILLDVMMPILNGVEVCRQIKANPKTGHIPVLLVTALGEHADRLRGIQAGADDFLTKPIDREEITLRIHNALVTKQLRDQVASEEALVNSEARFRALIENSKDMIFLLNPDGSIQYASPSVKQILGYTPQDFLTRNIFDYEHPDDVAHAKQVWQQLVETPESASINLQVRTCHANGTWRVLEGMITKLLHDPAVSAIVINCRDVTERFQHEQELEAISVVSAALRSSPTRIEMLPIILDQVMALFKAEGAALAIRDPSTGESVFEMTRGNFLPLLNHRFPTGKGLAGQVIETGEPLLLKSIKDDPRILHVELFTNVQSAACLPLIAQGNTIGALLIGQTNEIMPNEMRLLTSIADISANAIHRASLFEQTERQLEHNVALRQIDIAISNSLDLHVTLNVLLMHALTQLHADAADILILNSHLQTLEYTAGKGFRSRSIERFHQRVSEGNAGRAVMDRTIIFVPNLSDQSSAFHRPELLPAEGFITYHAVPLVIKGQVKGVLEIYHRSIFYPDPEWVDLLETLAGQAAIAIDNAELFQGMQRSNMDLVMAYDATLEGWSRALDLRDKETEGHTLRVTDLTLHLAQAMNVLETDWEHIRRGALLHDIGKMGIPDKILLKPGTLTPEEWEIMRKHPVYAYELLSPIAYLHPALNIPYCHHEKWDGTGYPRGLKGEQIPIEARIFAVADVWDALTSDRPYRAAWSKEQAIEYIQSHSGHHFDPQVARIFLSRFC